MPSVSYLLSVILFLDARPTNCNLQTDKNNRGLRQSDEHRDSLNIAYHALQMNTFSQQKSLVSVLICNYLLNFVNSGSQFASD